jgi:hypothetical protein
MPQPESDIVTGSGAQAWCRIQLGLHQLGTLESRADGGLQPLSPAGLIQTVFTGLIWGAEKGLTVQLSGDAGVGVEIDGGQGAEQALAVEFCNALSRGKDKSRLGYGLVTKKA